MEAIENGWTGRIAELEAEVARLNAEREAIQNDSRAMTCAFCGLVYPPGTSPSNHAALVAHVEECTKHPLRVWKVRAAAAESYLHVCRESLGMLSQGNDALLQAKEVIRGSILDDMVPVIDAELEYRKHQPNLS
jgi:hypothetical protein